MLVIVYFSDGHGVKVPPVSLLFVSADTRSERTLAQNQAAGRSGEVSGDVQEQQRRFASAAVITTVSRA